MKEDSSGVREYIDNLLRAQKLMVLASNGPEYPYCNLVGFASTGDLRSLIFVTGRDTRKYNNIKADGKVSLLLDNRRNSVSDFREAAAVSVLGFAEEASGEQLEEFRELYLQRHPHLHEFVNSPYTAIMKVTVSRYILVRRFQEVVELDME